MLRRMKDSNTEGNAASAAAHRRQLSDRAKEFADIHIAQRTDLHDQTEMPSDLWQALGDAGLAKIALPLEYGGMGGDYRALAMAAEAMAETGGNLGVVTSWMGRPPTTAELATATDLTEKEVTDAQRFGRVGEPRSLDAPVESLDSDGSCTLADLIGDDDDEMEFSVDKLDLEDAMGRLRTASSRYCG